MLFLDPQAADVGIQSHCKVSTSTFTGTDGSTDLPVSAPAEVAIVARAPEPTAALVNYLSNYNGRMLLLAESSGRREALIELLRAHHIHTKACDSWESFLQLKDRLCITVAALDHGLVIDNPPISIITEHQIYGQRVSQQRRGKKRRTLDADAIISNLTDLHIGSPVVHIDYGIGRYQGLQHLSGGDPQAEYLTIEYAGGDKLYVPVTSLHLLSR